MRKMPAWRGSPSPASEARLTCGAHGAAGRTAASDPRSGPLRALIFLCVLGLALAAAAVLAASAPANAGKVLVFTGTAGAPNDSTDEAAEAIRDAGASGDFDVDISSDAAAINAANLAGYRAVVFVHSSGDVLDAAGQAALQDYVEDGGGFVGIGETAGLQPGVGFFDTLLGLTAERTSGSTGPSAQDVEFLDRAHPATRDLPMLLEGHSDQWFTFTTAGNPTGSVHTVARARFLTVPTGESVTNDAVKTANQPPGGQTNRPVSWCRDIQQGRSFFTGLGRTEDAYESDELADHLLGAVQWAAGTVRGNCKATINSNYQATRLTPPNPAVCALPGETVFDICPPDTRRFAGESDGIAIADDGSIFYIGRAACGQGHSSGTNPPPGGLNQYTNWDHPLTGLGCGTLHVWDPNVEGPDEANPDKVTHLRTFEVFGAKGSGPESGPTAKAEHGMLGIALDPDFTNGRPYIYVNYTPYRADRHGPGFDRRTFMSERRLSRFTYDFKSGKLVGSEKVIMHWLAQAYSCCHLGGAMDFDSAGNLYIATGDNTGNTPNSANGGYTNAHPNFTVPLPPDPDDPESMAPVIANHNETPGGGVISFSDARQTSANSNSLEGKMLRIKPLANPGPTPKLAISAPGQTPGPIHSFDIKDYYGFDGRGFEWGANGDFGEGKTYKIPGENAPNGPNLFDGTEDGGGKSKREVFAMGVRNLYSLNVDPVDDLVTAAWVGPDQGQNSTHYGPAKTEWAVIMDSAGFYGWPYCAGAGPQGVMGYRAKLPAAPSGAASGAPFGHPGTVGGEDFVSDPPAAGHRGGGGWWDCQGVENPQGLPNDSPYNTGLDVIPLPKPNNIWYGPNGGCYDFPRNEFGIPVMTQGNAFDPVNAYRRCPFAHGGGQAAITGPIYRKLSDSPTAWPEYWDGQWFLADYTGAGNLRHALLMDPETMTEGGQPVAATALSGITTNATAGGNNSLIDLGWGSDGALYTHRYSSSGFQVNQNSSVWRFTYIGGPDTPGPDPQATPTGTPRQVAFSVGRSGGVSYHWDFGDGTTSTDPTPTHTYRQVRTFEATLTVTYADGEEATETVDAVALAEIPVNLSPPTLSIVGEPSAPVVGAQLKCHEGRWTAAGSYQYSWKRDGVEFTPSEGPSRHNAGPDDAGATITCEVTRTNRNAVSDVATSNPIAIGG